MLFSNLSAQSNIDTLKEKIHDVIYWGKPQYVYIDTLAKHQRDLKITPYVFEGTITRQECYNNKKGEMWTCTIFQITKIFKGNPQIKLGSIKVVTFQSVPGMKVMDGGPELGKKGTYVILGRPADSSMLNDKMIATYNSIILCPYYGVIEIYSDIYNHGKLVEQSHAEWEGGRWNPGTSYKSLEDLYAFFKENGLTVQEEVKQSKQLIVPADSIKQKKQ